MNHKKLVGGMPWRSFRSAGGAADSERRARRGRSCYHRDPTGHWSPTHRAASELNAVIVRCNNRPLLCVSDNGTEIC
jgi:hypothetical protein